MDIINSMYENVRSRVKCNNTLSDDYSCCFFGGQTRGITVSILIQYVLQWYRWMVLKKYILICLYCVLLLYADDTLIMSETEEGLKHGLFCLKIIKQIETYCKCYQN